MGECITGSMIFIFIGKLDIWIYYSHKDISLRAKKSPPNFLSVDFGQIFDFFADKVSRTVCYALFEDWPI